MFEIGFWELALIFALGLVVLGPEKLPKVAAQLGRYAGQARRMARTLTAQIQDELEAEERHIRAKEPRPATPEPGYSRPGAEDLIPGNSGVDIPATPSAAEAPAGTADRPQA